MAAAFHRAGFTPFDVHMTDLFERRLSLDDFRGLVVCGGFSYGDVLGAGEGWAKSILFHSRLRDDVQRILRAPRYVLARRVQRLPDDVGAARDHSGHAALAALRAQSLRAVRRAPEPGRGRGVAVAVLRRHGRLAHADCGCARRRPRGVRRRGALDALVRERLLSLRFVDNDGRPAERYPANPNGSPRGLTGITTPDGRVTLLMPHPERVFRTAQNSWHPDEWGEDSPWMRIWRNARGCGWAELLPAARCRFRYVVHRPRQQPDCVIATS